MSEKTDLLPCPFCGSQPFYTEARSYANISCPGVNCPASISERKEKGRDFINAQWNLFAGATPAEPEQSTLAAANAEIARLRAALVAQEDAERLQNAMFGQDHGRWRSVIKELQGKYGDVRLADHARELRRAALAGKDGAK